MPEFLHAVHRPHPPLTVRGIEYGLGGYAKCPGCGYWAFDGEVCLDCGWRPR